MKQTIDKYDFRIAMLNMRPDNFSLIGLDVLFQFLEDYEASTGEEIDLDVIELCSEYSEESWQDIAGNYSIDLNDANPEDDDYELQCMEIVQQYLEENTVFVGESHVGHFIYQVF